MFFKEYDRGKKAVTLFLIIDLRLIRLIGYSCYYLRTKGKDVG